MSDFDKEAEREKLREKFEAEEDKRAATEQMSELLLKGATMTNAHCSDCGDPIFRYDGQEFCPSCQKPVARDQGETDDGAESSGDGDDQIQVADPSDDARVQFGGQGASAEDGQQTDAADVDGADEGTQRPVESGSAGADPQSAGEPSRRVPSADPEHTPDEAGGETTGQPSGPERKGDRDSENRSNSRDRRQEIDSAPDRTPSVSPRTSDDTDETLAEAESLLAETVRRFAERAAATDDPRRARDHLAAAREAAEALDATRF